MAKPKHIFLNLPEFSEFEEVGFGLPVAHRCQVPSYLAPWLSVKKESVRFTSARIPLLDETLRRRLASISVENNDCLALLGTKNNISRILLACSASNIVIVESAARDWIRIALPADEWFELATPKLLALENALKSADERSGLSTACLVASSRYFGIEELN